MKITHLRTCHVENPLGFAFDPPCVSWVTESDAGAARPDSGRQAAAQVTVAKDEEFREVVFQTEREEGACALGCPLPFALEPRTRYWWRVRVRAEDGETAVSGPAFFETAKLGEPWQAAWITPALSPEVHPLLRRRFSLPAAPVSARAYVCGLGLYEMEVNGCRAGTEYLAPGFHAYDSWLQYQTYDITPFLCKGENAVGVMLGNGWYKGRIGFEGGSTEVYGSRFALLCELRIRLTDGTELTVGTDESWKSRGGPVLFSGIYDGEVYDAGRELPRWSHPACDEAGWAGVERLALGYERLSARRSPPIVMRERLKPVGLLHSAMGETILDFGQNIAGWVEFETDLPCGGRVRLQYGEILQEGKFYRDNLRTAEAETVYFAGGGKRLVRPHFTYYGFRYVKVTGLGRDFDPGAFTACALYSDLDRTGFLETGSGLVNRLIENALWGQRSNFLDVPTDCPQRDERMGWTGDAQIFAGTASFNMYTPAFYAKYLADLRFEQQRLGGSVPYIVPQVRPRLPEERRDMSEGHGSCAWGDAATVIPWTLYLFCGDKTLLGKQYGGMKAWVDYIKRQTEEHGTGFLWKTGFHFADWLALDNPDPASPFGGTDPYYVASAYYFYSALLTAKAARALGKAEDAAAYGALADEIRRAFWGEYFTADGACRIGTQTALALALFMGLAPEENRAALAAALHEKLLGNGMRLDTGFVGTPVLCRALSNNGYNADAYTLLLNEDYPGWLHEVKLGATTVWERWNSVLDDGRMSGTGMNSLNHYAYGSVVEWICRDVCGLNPVEGAPGFRRVLLRPRPDRRLGRASLRYDSPAGMYESAWVYGEDGALRYDFRIPFDARAEVVLPGAGAGRVRAERADGAPAALPAQKGGDAVFELGAGRYTVFAEP